MLFLNLLFLFTLVSITAYSAPTALILPAQPLRECGTSTFVDLEAEEQVFKTISKIKSESAARPGGDESLAPIAPRATTIDVYVHVVQANTSLLGGALSRSDVDAQILVLNQDYNSTGFSFDLASMDSITNPTWFNYFTDNTEEEIFYATEMKAATAQGSANDLNLWTVGFTTVTTLGYATFSWNYTASPVSDGVVLRFDTFPGISTGPYNLGRTATHEIGHWLGLYHPFQGECEGNGDNVADTPRQFNATYGCPEFKDTCVLAPGSDSIHNFMDYSNDVCLTEFTPGQIERMTAAWETYRAPS